MTMHNKLDREFSRLEYDPDNAPLLQRCRMMASFYADTENVLAVLSDLSSKRSYLYPGNIVRTIDIDTKSLKPEIPSIWETEIFAIIHPDDLERKYIDEMRFLRFVTKLPRKYRGQYYLLSGLRIRTGIGQYSRFAHRIFYFSSERSDSVQFALCLYGRWPSEVDESVIVNMITGECHKLSDSAGCNLLTAREAEILKLVSQGVKSRQIAELLSISRFTVNRHRQNIIDKLKVANSAEACRVGRKLKLC